MKRDAPGARGGFTLIELLLTISLVALMSSMFVVNIASLLRNGELETLENAYWKAVDSARLNAVFTRSPHFIDWDEDEQGFVVSSGEKRESFPVDTSEFGDLEIEVLFEEIAPENSYVLIRGELVAKREIVSVGFFPDGTCTPYTVSMKIGEFFTEFQMDPWTGAQLVDPNENGI